MPVVPWTRNFGFLAPPSDMLNEKWYRSYLCWDTTHLMGNLHEKYPTARHETKAFIWLPCTKNEYSSSRRTTNADWLKQLVRGVVKHWSVLLKNGLFFCYLIIWRTSFWTRYIQVSPWWKLLGSLHEKCSKTHLEICRDTGNVVRLLEDTRSMLSDISWKFTFPKLSFHLGNALLDKAKPVFFTDFSYLSLNFWPFLLVFWSLLPRAMSVLRTLDTDRKSAATQQPQQAKLSKYQERRAILLPAMNNYMNTWGSSSHRYDV